MSLDSYVWKVYCVTEGQYVSTVSDTEPTTCPNNPLHTIDPQFTAIIDTQFVNIVSDSYINIESTLADNQAIKIITGPTGGIDINAGFGGITIDTSNSIQLNGAAASNLSTTLGNLTLEAAIGLVNIDGGAGINIGNSGTDGPIFIGTTCCAPNITLGNFSGGTSINLNGGTGGINMNTSGSAISLNAIGATSNFSLMSTAPGQDLIMALLGATASRLVLASQGTGTDSIFFNTSSGGLQASIAGNINLTSSNVIALNSSPSGGVNITSGSQGIIIDCPSFNLITIGRNNASEYIIVGNPSGQSYLGLRAGTSGIIKTQQAPTVLADADATLTIAQLLTNLFTITPSVTRTLTLDTAANLVAGVYSALIGDSFDFTIINEAGATGAIVAPGTNGTLYGSGIVNGTGFGTGSSLFRVRITNVTGGTETYDLYRIS